MSFFTTAVSTMSTLVVALGGGVGVWGVVNLMEGYGADNPASNIYRLLLAFDEVYHSATEAEQKEFMKAFIERIEMFPEKRKDGSWIKKIVFNFPVPVDGEEVKELPLETETTVETVVLLSHKNQMTR